MKKIVIAALVAAFMLSSTSVMAARVKCTVDDIDGATVTLTCKKADKLEVGQKVQVKAKKKAAYEGC